MQLEEFSRSFDLDDVAEFLGRVSSLITRGFGPGDVADLTRQIEDLELDAELKIELRVTFRGRETALRVEAFMDDVETPDLAIFAAPELVREIKRRDREAASEDAGSEMAGLELLRTLRSDPNWTATKQERERQHQASVERTQQAHREVLADLARVGVEATSLQELERSRRRYRAAIPILAKWLHQSENSSVQMLVIGALGKSWANPEATRELIAEFRSRPNVRWEIGNKLARMADREQFDALVEIATVPEYGTGRQMLTEAIARTRHPMAADVLIELLADEDVAGHAVIAGGVTRSTGTPKYRALP
ncbi:MAG: hypothetical protein ACJ77A_00350 [Actinomycetota bacterium]